MLTENRKFGLKTKNRFYFFGHGFSNLFFGHFRQGIYIKIAKCQVKLIYTYVECLQKVFIRRSNMAGKETMNYKI